LRVFAHGVQNTTDELSTEPEPGNPRGRVSLGQWPRWLDGRSS
jgi:hypothetical protein